MYIVIDTNIWIRAMVDKEFTIECGDVINKFVANKEYILALDIENKMEREYRDEIRDNRRFELEWKRLSERNRLYWCSSNLPNNVEKQFDKLGFHEPEDRIFVGTALHSGKIIITDDSDYGANGEEEYQAVFEYMRDKLDLKVYSSEKFCNQNEI